MPPEDHKPNLRSNIVGITRQEYDSKVDLLCEWADAYYAQDQPVVPDSVYDQLFREVQAIEAATPEWVRLDSPTLRVGAPPLKEFGQLEHGEPMLSIDNALNAEEEGRPGIVRNPLKNRLTYCFVDQMSQLPSMRQQTLAWVQMAR